MPGGDDGRPWPREGEGTHPVGVGDDLETTDDSAEVAGDRGLESEESEGLFLGAGRQLCHPFAVADDLFGNGEVGLQERLGGTRHRGTREFTHFTQDVGQLLELLLVGSTHVPRVRRGGTVFFAHGR